MIGDEMMMESRVETGVPGMDSLIEGGLIRNSSVLLRGKAGTGKTIFALQYLLHGAQNGEPGVLLSIEETKRDLYREAAKFGWDLESAEEAGDIAIIERQNSYSCLLYTSPSPRDRQRSRMPSSA